jgi:nucleoside-diphosphate-sugar epimerase
MNIIVTGATGFVGRNLVEHFHAEGYSVKALGRSPAVGEALKAQGIAFAAADLRSLDEIIDAFCPADAVIHCAAKSGPWGRYRDFYEANVVGTRNVIAACRHHGIRKIFFISTPSIYFTGKDRFDISEDDPLPERPASSYAASKRICEAELTALRREGFQTIIFRPRALCGPYDNTFVPRILRMAEKGKVPLIDGGNALVDITYTDDFIDAVNLALTAPDAAWNQVYNISNGDPIRVKGWFAQVLEIFEKPFRPKEIPEPAAKTIAALMEFFSYLPFVNREPPMTRFTVGYMARSMTMNIDKAKRLLGYRPAVSHRQGFERYAAWVRSRTVTG